MANSRRATGSTRTRLLFFYLVVCLESRASVQAAFLATKKDRNHCGFRTRSIVSTSSTAGGDGRLWREQSSKNSFPSSSSYTILFSDNNSSSEKNQRRRPWDVIRFVRQSSRFVNPFPGSGTKPSVSEDRRGKLSPGTLLWKAGQKNDFEFAPLDDVVMGGASVSNFDRATGKWTGTVTDANNGGFAGVRSTPLVDFDLSGCGGIEWTLAGTERDTRLKIVLRDSADFNGIGWTTSRDTAGSLSRLSSTKPLTTLKIPFDGNGNGNQSLVPSRFAKILTDAPPFASSNVKAFQLTYSKFEYDGGLNPKFYLGDFSIQLLEIRAY